MSVRKARESDVCGVLALEGAWETTPHWTRKQFQSELSAPGSVFLVAERSDKLLGFAIARRYPPNLEVLDIAVAVPRQGIGRELFEALKHEAAGCSTLTLEVSARNATARAFYAALGLRVVGSRPKFYNDGADAVLMDLTLP